MQIVLKNKFFFFPLIIPAILFYIICYFLNLEAYKRQIKQREADVKITLTSDLKHSHMATEGLTSVAAPPLIDLNEKGENAVTRDYYQLTHEIANHRAVMEHGEAVRDQFEPELGHSMFPCLAKPADKHQGEKYQFEQKITAIPGLLSQFFVISNSP